MSRSAHVAALALMLTLSLAAGAAAQGDATNGELPAPPPDPDAALRARALGAGFDSAPSYLRANVRDQRGRWGYVHLTPDDMPLEIAVGLPKEPPRYGSRADAREAVLEGIRVWVRALRPHIPWFAVHFVERDPDAAVRIEWKRQITGPFCGFGGMGYQVVQSQVVVSAWMELSTRPDATSLGLSVNDIREIVAHEFGHVLGLSHCLHCDSIMNYADHAGKRDVVTATDVKTYLHLLAQPNGVRHDGGLLEGLTRPGWAYVASQP